MFEPERTDPRGYPLLVENQGASVACSSCRYVFDDYEAANALPRTSCPRCGETSRSFPRYTFEALETHDQVAFKARHAGGKKPFLEGKAGDSQSADGRWATIEQVVDRANNRYRKKVTDSAGTIVRDVDEPLNAHRGYGSAKPMPPTS